MATATLEIDQTLLQTLQAQASNLGLSVDALLRKFAENKNNELALSYDTEPKATQLTPYQIAKAKGLLGAVDSNVPNPDSPPIHTEFGEYLAKKHEDEKQRFFVLEEIAEKEGVTPQEWVRKNCPDGKDNQGRSLSQILDSFSVTEMTR